MVIAGFSSVGRLSVVRNEDWEVYTPPTNFGCCLGAESALLVRLSLEVLG
jgi:hypothetical protein